MSLFAFADESLVRALATVLGSHQSRLADAQVKVQPLFAMPGVDAEGEPTGPALAHNGHPVLSQSKILGFKDRLTRAHDCEILIDRDAWEVMEQPQRVALVDHALTCFEVRRDDQGEVKRDALNRPKMSIRKHDRFFYGFDEVAERHGVNSLEAMNTRRIMDDVGQYYLPGFSHA